MNKKMVMFVAVLVAVVVMAASVNAGVYVEDFDSYAVGSNMNGQGGWEDWSGPTAAGGIVSLVKTVDSDNVIDISGGSDLCYDQMDYTSGGVSFSMNQYIPSTSTGVTYFILLNEHLAAPSWAMQLSFDLGTGLVQADMDSSLGTFSILTDQWASIEANIDLDNNTVKVYYEGTLIRDGAFSYDAEPVQLTTLDLFANNADVVYYDDFAVAEVPEPATMGLLGMGALALFRRRRK